MEIKYELTKTPKEKPTGALGFGHIFTDHMFVMDYDEGKGWHDARIVPYPAAGTGSLRAGVPLCAGVL